MRTRVHERPFTRRKLYTLFQLHTDTRARSLARARTRQEETHRPDYLCPVLDEIKLLAKRNRVYKYPKDPTTRSFYPRFADPSPSPRVNVSQFQHLQRTSRRYESSSSWKEKPRGGRRLDRANILSSGVFSVGRSRGNTRSDFDRRVFR